MSARSYVLRLQGGSDVARAALADYNDCEFATLGDAREVTRAIKILFPGVRCKIVSVPAPTKLKARLLDG